MYSTKHPDPIKYAVDASEIKKPHNHKFSVKHELITDAEHLKVFDRTHKKRCVW